MNQSQFWRWPERKKHYFAVMLASLLMLAGCDQSDSTDNNKAAQSQSTEIQSAKAPQQSNTPPKSVKQKDATSLAELAKRYAGKEVTILDASEVQLDGASAMVVTFSVPLDPNQNFAQNVRLVDVKQGKLDGAWELSDNMMELRLRHLPPSRKLQLTVDKGVKGINERQLETAYEKTLTTETISPSVGFASKGSLLPSKVAEGLPVLALNVNSIDVNFFRIKETALPSFIAQWQYRNSMNSWESEEILKDAELVYTGRFDLNPTLNTREKLLLPLNNIKALQKDGVYMAVMQQAGKYIYANPATMFTLSDIGVSVHSYLDKMDVFTQSLEQGDSLKGVEVRLLDEKGQLLSKAMTDADGHASLEKNAKAKLLLATRDNQTSMIDLVSPALDLSEFDIAGPQGYSKLFFCFRAS